MKKVIEFWEINDLDHILDSKKFRIYKRRSHFQCISNDLCFIVDITPNKMDKFLIWIGRAAVVQW